MPTKYYILMDDRRNWFYADSPDATAADRTCKTREETIDHLKSHLVREGLEMGELKRIDNGFLVETSPLRPSRNAKVRRSMLYSPDCLESVDSIKDQLDGLLKDAALDIAVNDGRNLISGRDVLAAFEALGLSKVFRSRGEASFDGR